MIKFELALNDILIIRAGAKDMKYFIFALFAALFKVTKARSSNVKVQDNVTFLVSSNSHDKSAKSHKWCKRKYLQLNDTLKIKILESDSEDFIEDIENSTFSEFSPKNITAIEVSLNQKHLFTAGRDDLIGLHFAISAEI